MKTSVKWFIGIFLLINCSCSLRTKNDLKLNTYETIYVAPRDSVLPGLIINPGDSFQLQIDLKKYDFPVKRKLRIAGGSMYPAPFKDRDEGNFRNFLYLINDCLDSTDTYKQKFSLYFKGENDFFPRNTFFRLSENEIIKGAPAVISFAAKASGLTYSETGGIFLEIQFYFKKPGIHPDDIFDNPDLIKQIAIPPGTFNWKIFSEKISIPSNTACILFRLGGKGFTGICRFEAPQIMQGNKAAPISQFARFDAAKNNWIGENLTTKEWPEFEFSLDNKIFFTGKIFDRASNISDFEIELPQDVKGNHSLKIKLLENFPSAFPFLIRDIGLLESARRDFEVAYVPEFVLAKKNFALLVETNIPGVDLQLGAKGAIHPLQEKMHFEEPGLYAVQYHADSASLNAAIIISDKNRQAEIPVRQVLHKNDDNVMLATTDDIYIGRNKADFSAYLEWYCREGIGNAIGFRPSYQWSGARNADPVFYKWAVSLFQQSYMPYALMVECRNIPEKEINPPDEIISSPLYMGRQAHENDGGFYYWGHFKYVGLYTDLFANLRAKGGIFAKTRVKRTGNEKFVFFDPYACKNMKEGADMFVNNIKESKGESTRHTGPSTMFRYFYQAGYNWLGAEQMYGPEEVIISSLRGASKAYGKTDFGTHLATQWGSGSFEAPEHATRLFLSLAVSYMHDANHINTEDGLWNTEDDHNRYTPEGKKHIMQQKKLLDYIQTHQRRGNFVAPVAVIQGRYDAWKCFVRKGSAWSLAGDEWTYGPAERSFDLLNVFYPNSVLDAIYKYPCPKEKQGWYTGMPYGPVDLLPIEAPENILSSYKAIAFLGWNTFREDDFIKLLSFVKNGGTLLLARPHMNTELKHGAPAKLPENKILEELLGINYSSAKGVVRRSVGNGKVIYFASNVYPVDSSVRSDYEKELASIGEMMISEERKKGWIKGTDVVEFTAYDWPDNTHRTIYLLNTDWWSNDSIHSAKILLGEKEFEIKARIGYMETLTIKNGIAVMPSSMQTDIMEMKVSDNKLFIKAQTTGPDKLTIYTNSGKVKECIIKGAGIHEVGIEINN